MTLQQDAKRTYLLNSVLLRNLHEETLRADANTDRVQEMNTAMKHLHQRGELEGNHTVPGSNSARVNYETELCKERVRSEVLHERNQLLVGELAKERQLNSKLQAEKSELQRLLSKGKKI